jgi:hypothetical protein
METKQIPTLYHWVGAIERLEVGMGRDEGSVSALIARDTLIQRE